MAGELGNERRKPAAYLSLAVLMASLHCGPSAFADQDNPVTADEPIQRPLLLAYLADHSTFTLIDARSGEEFAASHISGAINIPHDTDTSMSLPVAFDAPIVVYCKTGKRAALLRAKLLARGYTDVTVLRPQQIHWFDGMAVFNCSEPAADMHDRQRSLHTTGKREETE